METINKVLGNVLTAIYQPFWFAVLLSVAFMYFYMYAKKNGIKQSLCVWRDNFKTSGEFRRVFFLVFYTTMILFRTLLNRTMWANPVSNVIGNWWLYNVDSKTGEVTLTTEFIENVLLFVPFTVLLLWAIQEKILGNNVKLLKVIFISVKYTFTFSIVIEFLQLFLRLGTFQLSDIFYNTLGGLIGGICYYIIISIGKSVKKI